MRKTYILLGSIAIGALIVLTAVFVRPVGAADPIRLTGNLDVRVNKSPDSAPAENVNIDLIGASGAILTTQVVAVGSHANFTQLSEGTYSVTQNAYGRDWAETANDCKDINVSVGVSNYCTIMDTYTAPTVEPPSTLAACIIPAVNNRDGAVRAAYSTYSTNYRSWWTDYKLSLSGALTKYAADYNAAQDTYYVAMDVAFKTYSDAKLQALETRQNALVAAWMMSNTTERNTAIKAAWDEYRSTVTSKTGIKKTLSDTRKTVTNTYNAAIGGIKSTYKTSVNTAKQTWNNSINGKAGAKQTFLKARDAAWTAYSTARKVCTKTDIDQGLGKKDNDNI